MDPTTSAHPIPAHRPEPTLAPELFPPLEEQQPGPLREGPPSFGDLQAALRFAGLHRRALAQALAHYIGSGQLANGERRNACSRRGALSPRYLAKATEMDRRGFADVISKLMESGVLVGLALPLNRANIYQWRAMFHLHPACHNRGIEGLDENGDCPWCRASLRAGNDGRYPFDLAGWRELEWTRDGDHTITRGVIKRSPGGDQAITRVVIERSPKEGRGERSSNEETERTPPIAPPAADIPDPGPAKLIKPDRPKSGARPRRQPDSMEEVIEASPFRHLVQE